MGEPGDEPREREESTIFGTRRKLESRALTMLRQQLDTARTRGEITEEGEAEILGLSRGTDAGGSTDGRGAASFRFRLEDGAARCRLLEDGGAAWCRPVGRAVVA